MSDEQGRESSESVSATLNQHSLSRAVHARKSEYTRSHTIKVKIGSWNVAACPGTEHDLAGWFVEGKGISKELAAPETVDKIEESKSQVNIETVEAQEARRSKDETTVPHGDAGVAGGDEIDLYVLGLQEVVDLTSAREYMGYTDTSVMAKWKTALSTALPEGYTCVVEQQLSGLLLLIYASPKIAPSISSVSTVSVGTGMMGYLGNKGAVTSRLVLGETTRMVFVNCHLASGADPSHLERRCWDVEQILGRTQFEPVNWGGVMDENKDSIGEEELAFWFGDLNFRLDGLPGQDIRRLLMLHTKGEYDIGKETRNAVEEEVSRNNEPIVVRHVDSDSSSEQDPERPKSSGSSLSNDTFDDLPDPDDFVQDPNDDPASLQATLNSLIPHDQLRRMQKTRKVLQDGWKEGPITFLPTYKYDVGSVGIFDSSEKNRVPSWCDRILYRTQKDKLAYDEKIREEKEARRRDEEMKARGIDLEEDDDILFDYDPEQDAEEPPSNKDYDEYDDAEEVADPTTDEKLHLDLYTSHQRILSSDHKPLTAIFTVEYDAVVPELKTRVQQEVAWELDRAENEGRPGLTIVFEHTQESDTEEQSGSQKAPSSPNGVDFGGISYLRRKTRNITIANTSQVPTTFAFVDRPGVSEGEPPIFPKWLSVSINGTESDDGSLSNDQKKELTLEPGDTISVTLDIFIDDISLVKSLNDVTTTIDDVLVLRVTDGRDYFIPIGAGWLQTCFGRSIDELIRVPEGGVRGLWPSPKGKDEGTLDQTRDVCWSAPRELFKLTEAVDSIIDRVLADASMIEGAQYPESAIGWPFDKTAWTEQDRKIRETQRCHILDALDSDKNLSEAFPVEIQALRRLEILAEVLLLFLLSLTDGVITAELWSKLEQDMIARGNKQVLDTEEIKNWVLDVLAASPNHNISFVFLTSMLSRVAGELAPQQSPSLPPKTPTTQSFAEPQSPQAVNPPARSRTSLSLNPARLSLSFRGREQVVPGASDPTAARRLAVDHAYAEIFAPVIFRGSVPTKDRDRKVMEERRRDIVEAFVRGRK
ncbi:Endonuclease/exonuclease/phosphatase [Xylogone sp. PMI_703]|nr:Endonuclease/exonuclease/phosphatase [Xylogone sp. PMI_703]